MPPVLGTGFLEGEMPEYELMTEGAYSALRKHYGLSNGDMTAICGRIELVGNDVIDEIARLKAELAAIHKEIDEGVLTLTGAHGSPYPVGTLVETGEHYKARVEELEGEVSEIDAAIKEEKLSEYVLAYSDRVGIIRRAATRIHTTLTKDAEQCPECRHELVLVWSRLNEPARAFACPRCLQDALAVKDAEAAVLVGALVRIASLRNGPPVRLEQKMADIADYALSSAPEQATKLLAVAEAAKEEMTAREEMGRLEGFPEQEWVDRVSDRWTKARAALTAALVAMGA